MCTELFCSRVLIRQHKAQMKRKSREIQEALVSDNDLEMINIKAPLLN